MSFLPLVRLWLWISVLASVAGWTLSALGQLNRPGYAVFFAAFAVLVLVCRKKLGLVSSKNSSRWGKILRRFRRPLPLCFAVLAFLIFLGGAIYPPTTHTAFTYHIPRVLHWLAEGRWHWIHTPVIRMNYSGCGYEWLSAPLLLFTKSDRGLFLLNYLPYLLLPGLIFSVCTRLGVRARVAWQWMWLLPAGYIFLVQSGNVGNDVFAVVYALALVEFGCRAWVSRRVCDLWLCILASALLTSVKISNAPLVLSGVILVLSRFSLLRRNWVATLCILLLAAAVSFLPSAVANKYYCGDYLGLSIEKHPHLEMKNPLVGIWGNALQLSLDNFAPPFFVAAGWWNSHAEILLPQALVRPVLANFDTGFFWLGELPTEDWAGIGFGVSLLLALSIVASFRVCRAGKSDSGTTGALPRWLRYAVLVAPWLALLVYCSKSGLVTAAREITPYYAPLLPLLILGRGQAEVVRRRWWHLMAVAVMLLALAVLVVAPARPLWPAQTIISKLLAEHPGQSLLVRAQRVYSVYAGRSDPLACVRDLLPRDLRVVGFMGDKDDIDISLWRPYGSRRVEHFFLTDPPEQIRQHVQYVVLGGYNLKGCNTTLDAWLQQSGAELIATTNAMLKIAEGPQSWYVVKFNK